ncbi:MAG: hypothetical protein DRJ98_02965 [Thermoprotei archaeon]|nr:MAG: hypothetical protein DRJ98_02965 [Thermoprotei archaeon]RLF17773.1 MAG: hypothetical protein DRN06_03145 [Thermoprotei archaeon]
MDILYWAGCTFRYRFPEVVEDHLKLLEKLGFRTKRLTRELCCGDPLLLMGKSREFKDNAVKVSKLLRENNVDFVVTECAGCYHAFKAYEKVSVELPPIRHLSQVAAEALRKTSISNQKEKVAYHDPCELGRMSGVYDEPREALRAVAELVEPLTSKDMAMCCGGGGGLWALAPELCLTIAEIRLERDVEPIGVSKLVTACPACLLNLSIAAERRKALTNRGVEVVDLGSYLLSRLEEQG